MNWSISTKTEEEDKVKQSRQSVTTLYALQVATSLDLELDRWLQSGFGAVSC
jgi:hypothetical protein